MDNLDTYILENNRGLLAFFLTTYLFDPIDRRLQTQLHKSLILNLHLSIQKAFLYFLGRCHGMFRRWL